MPIRPPPRWRCGGGHPGLGANGRCGTPSAFARASLGSTRRASARTPWFGPRSLVFRPSLGVSLHFATSPPASSRSLRRVVGGGRVLSGQRSFRRSSVAALPSQFTAIHGQFTGTGQFPKISPFREPFTQVSSSNTVRQARLPGVGLSHYHCLSHIVDRRAQVDQEYFLTHIQHPLSFRSVETDLPLHGPHHNVYPPSITRAAPVM